MLSELLVLFPYFTMFQLIGCNDAITMYNICNTIEDNLQSFSGLKGYDDGRWYYILRTIGRENVQTLIDNTPDNIRLYLFRTADSGEIHNVIENYERDNIRKLERMNGPFLYQNLKEYSPRHTDHLFYELSNGTVDQRLKIFKTLSPEHRFEIMNNINTIKAEEYDDGIRYKIHYCLFGADENDLHELFDEFSESQLKSILGVKTIPEIRLEIYNKCKTLQQVYATEVSKRGYIVLL